MSRIIDIDSIGLCATCNNASTCVYRKARGFDALFCEMFDGSAPPEGNRRRNAASIVEMAPDSAAPGKRKGLCVNCRNRETCTLPGAEEGVWHCEEYE